MPTPTHQPPPETTNGNGHRAVIPIGPKGVELRDVDAMFRFARCYMQSGLTPPSFKNEQQLVIAWAKAAELGLSPLQAVEGMSVINNRVGIMGDLALAMVEASGLLEQKRVEYAGVGDSLECKVMLQRKGREPQTYSFSVKEARNAGIYDRSSTWKGYPRRMCYYRALGFGLRDEFSDVLKGTKTVEELQDYPMEDEARVRRARSARTEKPAAAVAVPAQPVDPPSANASEPLSQVRRLLESAKISEPEFIEILKAAQIPEAQNGRPLSEIPDRVLHQALESWETVVALAEELRAQKAEASHAAFARYQ